MSTTGKPRAWPKEADAAGPARHDHHDQALRLDQALAQCVCLDQPCRRAAIEPRAGGLSLVLLECAAGDLEG
jgi:hypothetical protein